MAGGMLLRRGRHRSGIGGQIAAQRINPVLQRDIEHVADHDHAAGDPLAHAAELLVIELGHAAAALAQRLDDGAGCFGAEAMSLGDFGDGIGHCISPCEAFMRLRRWRRKHRLPICR